jgi:hypothetical protein
MASPIATASVAPKRRSRLRNVAGSVVRLLIEIGRRW